MHLQEALSVGRDILKVAHPDAVTTLKHWLTILQARWDEVSINLGTQFIIATYNQLNGCFCVTLRTQLSQSIVQ